MEKEIIYKIISFKSSEEEITADIIFNKDHKIFEGHFPGNPVVPGVIQVQILKGLLARVLNTGVFLKHIKTIKFLHPLNPENEDTVRFSVSYTQLSENLYTVRSVVSTETAVHMKFSGQAQVISNSKTPIP